MVANPGLSQKRAPRALVGRQPRRASHSLNYADRTFNPSAGRHPRLAPWQDFTRRHASAAVPSAWACPWGQDCLKASAAPTDLQRRIAPPAAGLLSTSGKAGLARARLWPHGLSICRHRAEVGLDIPVDMLHRGFRSILSAGRQDEARPICLHHRPGVARVRQKPAHAPIRHEASPDVPTRQLHHVEVETGCPDTAIGNLQPVVRAFQVLKVSDAVKEEHPGHPAWRLNAAAPATMASTVSRPHGWVAWLT